MANGIVGRMIQHLVVERGVCIAVTGVDPLDTGTDWASVREACVEAAHKAIGRWERMFSALADKGE